MHYIIRSVDNYSVPTIHNFCYLCLFSYALENCPGDTIDKITTSEHDGGYSLNYEARQNASKLNQAVKTINAFEKRTESCQYHRAKGQILLSFFVHLTRKNWINPWQNLPKKPRSNAKSAWKSFQLTCVLGGSSSIWTCQISNICYCFLQSKQIFKIRHVQIDLLPRMLK